MDIEVLRRARALIAKGWTQNAGATDSRGCGVSPLRPEAVCFCAMGALWAVRKSTLHCSEEFALSVATRGLSGSGSIVTFNDSHHRTQQEVVGLYDLAIDLVEKGEVK